MVKIPFFVNLLACERGIFFCRHKAAARLARPLLFVNFGQKSNHIFLRHWWSARLPQILHFQTDRTARVVEGTSRPESSKKIIRIVLGRRQCGQSCLAILDRFMCLASMRPASRSCGDPASWGIKH